MLGNSENKHADIETLRLKLIQYNPDNVSVQSLAELSHPYVDGRSEEWDSKLHQAWDETQAITYAVFLKQTGMLIGAVGLVGIRGTEGGMGYWIGEPFWKQGYCTEAAKALVDYCFETLKLSRLEAEYLVTNPASGRVMQKIGMKYKMCRVIKDSDGNDAELNVYEIFNDKNKEKK